MSTVNAQPLLRTVLSVKNRLHQLRKRQEHFGIIGESAMAMKTISEFKAKRRFISVPVMVFRLVSCVRHVNNLRQSAATASPILKSLNPTQTSMSIAENRKRCSLMIMAILQLILPLRWQFARCLVVTTYVDLDARLIAIGHERSDTRRTSVAQARSRDGRMAHPLAHENLGSNNVSNSNNNNNDSTEPLPIGLNLVAIKDQTLYFLRG